MKISRKVIAFLMVPALLLAFTGGAALAALDQPVKLTFATQSVGSAM